MTRLPDSTFTQNKMGAERLRALECLVRDKTLLLFGRREIAERYVVRGGRGVHRRTIEKFADWGYATIRPEDGAATVTHLGILAARYWDRVKLKAVLDERRADAERDAAQEVIDLLARKKYRQ